MNVSIITLGCKVNQYESQAMLGILEEAGYKESQIKSADVVIVNSCTVTASSEQKVRQALRRAKSINQNAIIILTGCMPQAFPQESSKLSEADIVIGNRKRADILEYINSYREKGEKIIDIPKHESTDIFEPLQVEDYHGKTRAFLKIQDGCNRFCSYCIIPYARGRVRSKGLEELKDEIRKISENGYREIVLTGINLSCYGSDIGLTLCDAVEAACENEKIARIRLGSLEPEMLDKDVINRLAKQTKLCPQFHLSLQSGCDETLMRMNRHYTSGQYREIVNNLRNTFDNVAITTDIMVGFAGENEEEFEKSLAFVKEISFARAHVFKYSKRLGTKAYSLPDQVPNQIKDERSKRMISEADKSRLDFHKTQVGKISEVIFEQRDKKGRFEGYTENYTQVKVVSDLDLQKKQCSVKIIKAESDYCIGEIL